MTSYSVDLYVYDLSQGLAKRLTPFLLRGKKIEGIWHTGVVVYGREYFYGSNGLQFVLPGMTILGHTYQIVPMGSTKIPQEKFEDHLKELGKVTFRPEKYHLLDHNCNNFSNEACRFLVGKNIPSHITSLPSEILNSPLGIFLRPIIDEIYRANNQDLSSNPFGAASKDDHSQTSKDSSNNSSAGIAGMSQNPNHTLSGEQNRKQCNIQPTFHNIDDMDVLMIQLESLQEFDPELKLKIQRCLGNDQTVYSDDEICYFFNELVQLVKERRNPLSLVACELLQAFILRYSANSHAIFNGYKKPFFELLDHSTANSEIPELLLIICKCVCCLMSHVGLPDQFFNQSPNHSILTNFFIFCILIDDIEINTVACQSISNIFLLQSSELNGSESEHELYSETCFRIGISLFEMMQKTTSIDDIYACYCIYQCLKKSTEFLQFARAMYIGEDNIKEYFMRQTSNENINKLKASTRQLLSQDET